MPLDKTPSLLCVRCFASDTEGSWQHVVYGDEEKNHCTNCGAGNAAVPLPRWAIDDIRENASWIGKRYYPHREDREGNAELKLLRSKMTIFPGRSAEEVEEGQWAVKQQTSKAGKRIQVFVDASSAKEALEKAKLSLPYVETLEDDDDGSGNSDEAS